MCFLLKFNMLKILLYKDLPGIDQRFSRMPGSSPFYSYLLYMTHQDVHKVPSVPDTAVQFSSQLLRNLPVHTDNLNTWRVQN